MAGLVAKSRTATALNTVQWKTEHIYSRFLDTASQSLEFVANNVVCGKVRPLKLLDLPTAGIWRVYKNTLKSLKVQLYSKKSRQC